MFSLFKKRGNHLSTMNEVILMGFFSDWWGISLRFQ